MKTQNKIKSIEIKISKLLNWWLFWNYKSKMHWNWMDFAEHREYNFWDSIKNIDWKASSRWNSIQVKQYEEEKDLNILFVLDNSESMNFWSSNKTKKQNLEEIFYWLALSAYNNNDNIWAIIFDEKNIEFFENKKSKNNIFRIAEKLENRLSTSGLNSMKSNYFLKNIINKKIKNNLIIFLTDKTNFDEKDLKIINSQNEIIIINIFDEIENELVNIKWDISINSLNINLENKKILDYKNSRKKQLEKLKFDLEKNNIWYLKIDNKTNSFKELFKFFNKK